MQGIEAMLGLVHSRGGASPPEYFDSMQGKMHPDVAALFQKHQQQLEDLDEKYLRLLKQAEESRFPAPPPRVLRSVTRLQTAHLYTDWRSTSPALGESSLLNTQQIKLETVPFATREILEPAEAKTLQISGQQQSPRIKNINGAEQNPAHAVAQDLRVAHRQDQAHNQEAVSQDGDKVIATVQFHTAPT
jgi:hypothetical protein